MPDGIVISDALGRIVYANRRAEEITGYKRRELHGRRIELLVPRRLRAIHKEHRRDYNANPGPRSMGSAEHDFKVQRKNGDELSADIALASIASFAGPQVIAVIRDISERQRLEAVVQHQALHDPLTDLANRNLFFDRLTQAIHSAQRDGNRVALVTMDLDQFKEVNDSFGHGVGDALLKALAARLVQRLRATDTAARLGGDEFAWILPRVADHVAAERMVRRLLRTLKGSFSVGEERIEVSVSAGMAVYPDDGDDVRTLLRKADLGLYSAKQSGRGFASERPRVLKR
jgi:diguanylate cyclase (GGDEF)-like protein/PAS domain S-box-containing protein